MSKARRKRKSRGFLVGMLIYIAVALIVIFVVIRIFHGYLVGYEEAVVSHGMDPVLAAMNDAGIDGLITDDALVTDVRFESKDAYRSLIKDKVRGAEVTMKESPESTGELPRYILYANGDAFMDVTLKVMYSNRYGMDIWGYDKFYGDKYLVDDSLYTIKVPMDAVVKVNGQQLTEADLAPDEDGNPIVTQIDTLRNVTQYLSTVPYYANYEVFGFLSEPTIEVFSAAGESLTVHGEDKVYSADLPLDQNIVSELEPRVMEMIEAYGKHFIGVNTGSVYNYLLPGSEYRSSLSTATTYFYPTEKITTYNFDNKKAYDFVTYTDTCCSCEVYFDLIVNFNNASYKTQNEGSDATWVFIKQDGTWYLADVPRQKDIKE